MEDTATPLRNIQDALVLGFALTEEAHPPTFSLVTAYPHRLPGSDRAFSWFVFRGVCDYQRMRGNIARYFPFTTHFEIDDGTGHIEVQNVSRKTYDGRFKLTLNFGMNFGSLSLWYEELTGWFRDARVEHVGNDYLYFDFLSNEPYDFRVPFPDWLKPHAAIDD